MQPHWDSCSLTAIKRSLGGLGLSLHSHDVAKLALADGEPMADAHAGGGGGKGIKNRKRLASEGNPKPSKVLLDTILHPFKTIGTHCLLMFAGESSSQDFVGGAKWISQPFIVWERAKKRHTLGKSNFREEAPMAWHPRKP